MKVIPIAFALVVVGACGGSPTNPSPQPSSSTAVQTTTPPPSDPTPPAPQPSPLPQPSPTPAPAPVPPTSPSPNPSPAPPSAPAPVSIPYYARVTSQFSCTFPAAGFAVEWFPGRLVFGQTTFTSIVGPSAGDEPGDALATIKDDHFQTIVRLELVSSDGRTWQWGYDDASGCHAIGSLERR